MSVLVTGCAGFIGSNFVHHWLSNNNEPLINLDLLTYAGNLANLALVRDDGRHVFVRGDIGDPVLVRQLLHQYRPRALINFAAESHVDRSIRDPRNFIQTNVAGTLCLLECVRAFLPELPTKAQTEFRFVHISTDEVYGSLGPQDAPFAEQDPYEPNSPYSASKAASDHLVRAWHHTYGLPVLTINFSNNYGPYQFPEKLIPLLILNALANKPLPLYGDGKQIRDWLYVADTCGAIFRALQNGRIGETYNVGGSSEMTNLEVATSVCAVLDELKPRSDGMSYAQQIVFVKDRPGHDRRYAMNAQKIRQELGWKPSETFKSGLRKTVQWYLENPDWVNSVTSGAYREWIDSHYGS